MTTPVAWPANVTPGQAYGYLLARHVPLRYFPDGLRAAWAVAGVGPKAEAPRARSRRHRRIQRWLREARACAARLGPPPGLQQLLAAPADGMIRSDRTAAVLLAANGWDWPGGLTPLREFARIFDLDAAWTITQVGTTRAGDPVRAVVDTPSRIVRARQTARAAIAPTGVILHSHLTRHLDQAGVRLDPLLDPSETHAILATAGDRTWAVLHDDTVSALANLMRRLAAALGPVPLTAAHQGLGRYRPRHLPTDTAWPPTPDMIRAWVTHQRGWTLTGQDEQITPTRPSGPARPSDLRLVDALRDQPLGWVALQDAIAARGMTPRSADQVIVESHLILQPTPRGPYHLIHDPQPVNHPATQARTD